MLLKFIHSIVKICVVATKKIQLPLQYYKIGLSRVIA